MSRSPPHVPSSAVSTAELQAHHHDTHRQPCLRPNRLKPARAVSPRPPLCRTRTNLAQAGPTRSRSHPWGRGCHRLRRAPVEAPTTPNGLPRQGTGELKLQQERMTVGAVKGVLGQSRARVGGSLPGRWRAGGRAVGNCLFWRAGRGGSALRKARGPIARGGGRTKRRG